MDNFNLPSAVKSMLAQRARRLHHFIWHSVRNSWHRFPSSVQPGLFTTSSTLAFYGPPNHGIFAQKAGGILTHF